ncbi:MBL fold metallo-hydrolase [Egicoccus sp. AB-alg2]|uniref:MBL fold metallo-hydrolase n=1 Tax=Egicoccus sp. AB-alg2 TaxID=3242693 RepID=UPI00359E4AF5
MDRTPYEPSPHRITDDTWLIPHTVEAEPGAYLPVSSLLIRGEQPIVVDTGAPVHRQTWFEQIFSLVDPEEIRWIFLSHDDGDHKGNLHELLDLAPNATLVACAFLDEREALERPLPQHRQRWLEDGDTLDAGDRQLRLVTPPIFDGPTTRGLFDERSGVLWAVDAFAALLTGDGYEAGDVTPEVYDDTFHAFNSMISPWHQWLDPVRYARHVDTIAGLRPSVVTSSHGPVLRGGAIPDAFRRVKQLAGQPRVQPPGQELLDELIEATVLAGAAG